MGFKLPSLYLSAVALAKADGRGWGRVKVYFLTFVTT